MMQDLGGSPDIVGLDCLLILRKEQVSGAVLRTCFRAHMQTDFQVIPHSVNLPLSTMSRKHVSHWSHFSSLAKCLPSEPEEKTLDFPSCH
jgi:hypothetical protein